MNKMKVGRGAKNCYECGCSRDKSKNIKLFSFPKEEERYAYEMCDTYYVLVMRFFFYHAQFFNLLTLIQT
jgi:hypothetical protein